MFIGAMAAKTPLNVSASNVSGSDNGLPLSGLVLSETTPDPVITYGSGDYAYLWERVSGDTPSVSNAAVANPVWSDTVTDGDNSVSVWQLTVTDNQTGEQVTVTITVTLIWSSLS